MPAEARGPRLWFKRGNPKPEGGRYLGTWIIKDDGGKRVTTGVRGARGGKPPEAAQEALARYLIAKREVPRKRDRDADQVAVADVIAIYMQDCATRQARPKEVIGRCKALLPFWGDKTLADVTGTSCRDYVTHRGKAVARRELEDLRAAINHHRKEGLCRQVVEVVLPAKGEARDRWLTRSEAARLIWHAWRYREVQKGQATGRRSRQHVARFALVALYTGTRAGAVCSAAFDLRKGSGYIDLERGVFHRRPEGERETNKRKPPVKLPARLVAHMRRWRAQGQHYAVEWLGQPIGTGIEKAFRGTCRDAGLVGVTPHVLRHTAATWLMQRRTDPWEAAGFLGMSLETLERVYGHHSPNFQNQAAANIVRRA